MGKALLQSRVASRYYKLNKSYYKMGQVLESGPTLLQSEIDITKWGSSYKVNQYIDQRYIEESVRNIYCPPPFFIFAYSKLLETRKNGGTCLEIGPMRFESRITCYNAFRRDRPF